jgi:hypothetical protein
MRASRQYLVSVVFAFVTLVVGSGITGCGGAGSGGSASGPLPKADAVDVTYYYLPG